MFENFLDETMSLNEMFYPSSWSIQTQINRYFFCFYCQTNRNRRKTISKWNLIQKCRRFALKLFFLNQSITNKIKNSKILSRDIAHSPSIIGTSQDIYFPRFYSFSRSLYERTVHRG